MTSASSSKLNWLQILQNVAIFINDYKYNPCMLYTLWLKFINLDNKLATVSFVFEIT